MDELLRMQEAAERGQLTAWGPGWRARDAASFDE
jgi:hypothetical protein